MQFFSPRREPESLPVFHAPQSGADSHRVEVSTIRECGRNRSDLSSDQFGDLLPMHGVAMLLHSLADLFLNRLRRFLDDLCRNRLEPLATLAILASRFQGIQNLIRFTETGLQHFQADRLFRDLLVDLLALRSDIHQDLLGQAHLLNSTLLELLCSECP